MNTPIFQCTLGDAGEIEVTEVTEGEWLFYAKLPDDFATCIRVVSIERLPELAREAKAAANLIRQDLRSEEEAAWNAICHQPLPEDLVTETPLPNGRAPGTDPL